MLGQLSGFCDKIQNMKNMNEETSLEIKKKKKEREREKGSKNKSCKGWMLRV